MHSPVQDLALSGFTVRDPVGPRSSCTGLHNAVASLGEQIAEWRLRVRSRNQLRQLGETDWSVGDYGIARWQADAELRKPFWAGREAPGDAPGFFIAS